MKKKPQTDKPIQLGTTTTAILKRLSEANGGLLMPEQVIEFARPPSSPLHAKFNWDDTSAAHQYRLWQARQLLRVTVEIIKVNRQDRPINCFVSLTSDRNEDGGYRQTVVVMGNRAMRQQLIEDARAELEVFQKKYAELSELASVFQAIKKLGKRAA